MSEDAELEQDVTETTEVDTEVVDDVESSPAKAEEAEAAESSPESESKGVQKRIDELTKARREAERRAAYYEQQLAEMRQKPPEKAAEAEPLKTLADFDYDESKYMAYVVDQATKGAVSAAERKLQEAQAAERMKRQQAGFKAAESEYAATVPDYHEVTRNPSLAVTQEMVAVMSEMDDGPAVLYHLGKNPQVAERIAALSPVGVARELGRIEERLAVQKAQKGKSVSDAPAPAPKIKAANPAVQKDPLKMTDSEFAKWRRAQIARR